MFTQDVGVIGGPEVHGPGTDGADVKGEVLFVGGRGHSEGVVLAGRQGLAGDTHPLA